MHRLSVKTSIAQRSILIFQLTWIGELDVHHVDKILSGLGSKLFIDKIEMRMETSTYKMVKENIFHDNLMPLLTKICILANFIHPFVFSSSTTVLFFFLFFT